MSDSFCLNPSIAPRATSTGSATRGDGVRGRKTEALGLDWSAVC